MANKIKLARGTKARIETVKSNLDEFEIVYATDTDEIGVKKPDGNVKYIGSGGEPELPADLMRFKQITTEMPLQSVEEAISIMNNEINFPHYIYNNGYMDLQPFDFRIRDNEKVTYLSFDRNKGTKPIYSLYTEKELLDEFGTPMGTTLNNVYTLNTVVESSFGSVVGYGLQVDDFDLPEGIMRRVSLNEDGLNQSDDISVIMQHLMAIMPNIAVNYNEGTFWMVANEVFIPELDGRLNAINFYISNDLNVKYEFNVSTIEGTNRINKLVVPDIIYNEFGGYAGYIIETGGGGGKEFHRVRIFSDNNKLVSTQILYEGEKVLPLDKQGNLFDFGTRNLFDYNTIITEDIDLTYSITPLRYVQTTSADFDSNGDYTGTEEYIILPADKPNGYYIDNLNVKGVATNGDYLTETSGMFSGNNSLYLELDYLDTINVTTMDYMFSGSKATTLDLSSFDTSNVTDMYGMFTYSQATTLDLSSFDTINVTDMIEMFAYSQATTLDLSSFDTINVTDMIEMFAYSQATTLDLSSFDTINVTDMDEMFMNSQATTGYARTQTDADNFNNSSDKPSTLTFVVK